MLDNSSIGIGSGARYLDYIVCEDFCAELFLLCHFSYSFDHFFIVYYTVDLNRWGFGDGLLFGACWGVRGGCVVH